MCSGARAMSDLKGIGNVLREGIVCSASLEALLQAFLSPWLGHDCRLLGEREYSGIKTAGTIFSLPSINLFYF